MTVVDSCCAGGAMIVRSAAGIGGAGGERGGAEAAGVAGAPHDGAGDADAEPLHGGGDG